MIHMYSDLSIEQRRKFKANLLDIRKLSIKQKDGLYLFYLKPIDDIIKTIDEVLKNGITIEQFKYNIKKLQQRKKEVFDMMR